MRLCLRGTRGGLGGFLLLSARLAGAVHVHANTPRTASGRDLDDGGATVGAHFARRLELASLRKRVARGALVVVGAADETLEGALASMGDEQTLAPGGGAGGAHAYGDVGLLVGGARRVYAHDIGL